MFNIDLIPIRKPRLTRNKTHQIFCRIESWYKKCTCKPNIYYSEFNLTKVTSVPNKNKDIVLKHNNNYYYSVDISDLVKVSKGFNSLYYKDGFICGKTIEGMIFKTSRFQKVDLI